MLSEEQVKEIEARVRNGDLKRVTVKVEWIRALLADHRAMRTVVERAKDLLTVHDQASMRAFEKPSDEEACMEYAEDKLRDALAALESREAGGTGATPA